MNKHIERNPKILGGCWVVRGTRVPLRSLNAYHEKGMTFKGISMIMYPHITPGVLENAIKAYRNIYYQGIDC